MQAETQHCADHLFVLPHEGEYVVYAPHAQRLARVNGACLEQIREFASTGREDALSPEAAAQLGGLDWLRKPSPLIPLPADRLFAPTAVTLFLTNRCNLRCVYCYARAGDFRPKDISEELCRRAIDYTAQDARRAGLPVRVGFHGGGEPTMAWERLQASVEHAVSLTKKDSPPPHLAVATNGVMNETKAEYIAEHLDSVTISLDGPAEIHNAQRPLGADGDSFTQAMQTVQILRERRKPFGIRATITQASVSRMPELVDFFVDETGGRLLHLEPAFGCGRCAGADLAPSVEAFAEGYIRATERAAQRGVAITYSAARAAGQMRASFCGVCEDGFSITPDGDVTACYEVCDRSNPLTDVFYYGSYDAATGRFEIDMKRLDALREMDVEHREDCRRCFAKYQCAGDCPHKNLLRKTDEALATERCLAHQRINATLLLRAFSRDGAETKQAASDKENGDGRRRQGL